MAGVPVLWQSHNADQSEARRVCTSMHIQREVRAGSLLKWNFRVFKFRFVILHFFYNSNMSYLWVSSAACSWIFSHDLISVPRIPSFEIHMLIRWCDCGYSAMYIHYCGNIRRIFIDFELLDEWHKSPYHLCQYFLVAFEYSSDCILN